MKYCVVKGEQVVKTICEELQAAITANSSHQSCWLRQLKVAAKQIPSGSQRCRPPAKQRKIRAIIVYLYLQIKGYSKPNSFEGSK